MPGLLCHTPLVILIERCSGTRYISADMRNIQELLFFCTGMMNVHVCVCVCCVCVCTFWLVVFCFCEFNL